jgi:hypothetical protein
MSVRTTWRKGKVEIRRGRKGGRRTGKSYLICINENDFGEVEREEYIQEETLISPNDSLLLCLFVEPTGPLISHQLILKSKMFGHVRNEVLYMKINQKKTKRRTRSRKKKEEEML